MPEWTVYDDEIAALDRRRKGLPAEPRKAAEAEPAASPNPKSRTLEEPGRTKDEL